MEREDHRSYTEQLESYNEAVRYAADENNFVSVRGDAFQRARNKMAKELNIGLELFEKEIKEASHYPGSFCDDNLFWMSLIRKQCKELSESLTSIGNAFDYAYARGLIIRKKE